MPGSFPEPQRTFLAMLAEGYPWFRMGADIRFRSWPMDHPGRILTIRRIDFEGWSFHTSEKGRDKWFKWRLYDVTQFCPAEHPLDTIEGTLGVDP